MNVTDLLKWLIKKTRSSPKDKRSMNNFNQTRRTSWTTIRTSGPLLRCNKRWRQRMRNWHTLRLNSERRTMSWLKLKLRKRCCWSIPWTTSKTNLVDNWRLNQLRDMRESLNLLTRRFNTWRLRSRRLHSIVKIQII